MNNDFQSLFDTAVQTRGSDYLQARNALTSTDRYQSDLREVLHSPDKWNDRWVARIVLAWHTDADLFAEADTYLRGDLEGPRPITGEFGVDPRVRRVVGLGETVRPRLVEAAWKTQEYEGYARGAVFQSLQKLDDPDAAEDASVRPPLRNLLSPKTPKGYRTAAILTLGDLHDTESARLLHDILTDPSESTSARTAALDAYSSLDRPDAIETLKDVLENGSNPESLRVEAASRLIRREESGTRALFHNLIPTVSNGLLLITLVDGLETIGDETSISVLKTLQGESDDDYLLNLIDRVLSRLAS